VTKAEREYKLGLLVDQLQTKAMKLPGGSYKQKKILAQYDKIKSVLKKYNPGFLTPVQQLLVKKIAADNARIEKIKNKIQR
jgi:hypothetical protein